MKRGAEDNPLADDLAESEDNQQEASSGETTSGGFEDTGNDGVPYAVRRSGVKAERDMEPVWMQAETVEKQKDVKQEVERILGYDVYLTDFKEAAYLEGLSNPEGIAERLDDWGCEYA